MRAFVALLVLASCAGDDLPFPHDLTACAADWLSGEPAGASCELACEHRPVYDGIPCDIAKPDRQGNACYSGTITFYGVRGCCQQQDVDLVVFMECVP